MTNDSLAPRRAERLLEALGPASEFRDGVIGDLAEEFAIRCRWDGEATARRWYYRECVRVAPYLLRDWWRELRRPDVTHLAAVLVTSSAVTLSFEWCFQRAVRFVAGTVFSDWKTMLDIWASAPLGAVVFGASMALWTFGDGMLAGYIAARLSRRAPLATVLTLGVAGAAFLGFENIGSIAPIWFRVANVAALAAGVFAGGMLRVRRTEEQTPTPG